MKLPTGPLDGAQPRDYVLAQLRKYGVEVLVIGGGWFELTDNEGDPVVMQLDDPIVAHVIVYLFRRFGDMHDMIITDFVKPPTKH